MLDSWSRAVYTYSCRTVLNWLLTYILILKLLILFVFSVSVCATRSHRHKPLFQSIAKFEMWIKDRTQDRCWNFHYCLRGNNKPGATADTLCLILEAGRGWSGGEGLESGITSTGHPGLKPYVGNQFSFTVRVFASITCCYRHLWTKYEAHLSVFLPPQNLIPALLKTSYETKT